MSVKAGQVYVHASTSSVTQLIVMTLYPRGSNWYCLVLHAAAFFRSGEMLELRPEGMERVA